VWDGDWRLGNDMKKVEKGREIWENHKIREKLRLVVIWLGISRKNDKMANWKDNKKLQLNSLIKAEFFSKFHFKFISGN
jgi:hypothetical protein